MSFYEGVPASIDFRAWLSGTNRATATITEGDTFPAGFSFSNGVLSWDGTGSAPNTVENQMTASDGEGPDADSNLFNIQVIQYVPLSWDVMPNWNPVIGGGEQTYDVRSYLNGTNAATAVISGVAPTQLPVDSGYSWDGSVLTFLDTTQSSAELTIQATDGVGPAADSYFESIPVFSIDLISAEWTINNKNGTLDSRDPDYVPSALTWEDPQSDVFFSEGVSGSQDTRDNLSGSNAATATITQSGNTAAAGVAFDDGVYSYDGVASAGAAVPDTLTADDGVTSPSTNPFNVQIVGGAVGFTPDSGLNVSAPGGFITGEIVTITGTGFGTKPGGGKSLYYLDFSDGDPSGLLDPRSRRQNPDPIFVTPGSSGVMSSSGARAGSSTVAKSLFENKYTTTFNYLDVSNADGAAGRKWQYQANIYNGFAWITGDPMNCKWMRYEWGNDQNSQPYTPSNSSPTTMRYHYSE